MRMKPVAGLLVFLVLIATGAGGQEQSSTEGSAANPAPQQAAPANKPSRISLGGNVASAKITHMVPPVYPEAAKAAHVSGTVVLQCIIARDGTMMQLRFMSGPPLLLRAAMDAVRQWIYNPTVLNGEPVEVETTVSIVFTLGGTIPSDPTQQGRPPSTLGKSESADVAAPGAATDPQFGEHILHLMEVTHFKEKQQVTARQMLGSMRPALLATIPVTPNREKIVDAYMDKLSDLLQSDEFTARVVALYAQDLTDDDVKAAAAFYETPAGQHYLESAAKMAPDLMVIGQQLALHNIPSILRDLCKEYPELQGDGKFCAPTAANPTSLLNNRVRIPAGN
jgi:TonB family protein